MMEDYGITMRNASDSTNNTTFNHYMFDPYNYLPLRTRFDKILYEITVPIVFGFITLIGTIGNSLVIYVITCKNKMRSATNLLLLNLAIADLTFVLICPPFTAYQHAAQIWPFGNIACKLMHYLVNVSLYVTVYTLVLIALIRYLTIVHSQKTTRIRCTANILVMMGFIWIAMLLLNIPILWIYSAHTIIDKGPFVKFSIVECSINSEEAGKPYFTVLFVFSYVIPLFIILVFSICILRYIMKQRPRFLSGESRSQGNLRKKQASRILIIVVVLFAVLWFPLHINLTLIFYGALHGYINTNGYKLLAMIFHILAYSNSCVNPLVYNFVSKDFRDSFGDVVMCRRSSLEHILGTNVVTRTTTAQFSPDNRHKRKKCTEAETIPLSNGHIQSQADIGNGLTCDTEVEGADSVGLDML